MKYYVGVELGVKNIVVGVVDKYGKLLRKEPMPTCEDKSCENIIKEIADLIKKVLEHENIDVRSVKSIGVGSPGVPDVNRGVIVRNYTLNFVNAPIRDELQKYFNMPVYIDNDASCAALAESVAGAAEDIDHSVLISIGTGIGGGIIINNKIYSGFNYAGGEMGHMVIDYKGEKCTCGRNGCWEAYASATALIKQTREAALKDKSSLIHEIVAGDISKIDEFTAYEASKRGDKIGKAVFDQYLEYLAEGTVNIINMLMPEVFVIAGHIRKIGDGLFVPLTKLVHERIYTKDIPLPEFRAAETGNAAIVIGAAMLGLYKNR